MRLLGGCGGRLLLQAHEEAADVGDAEAFEPLATEERHQVEADVRFVLVEGAELAPGLDDVVQPVRQPLGELGRLGGHGHALVHLVEQLPALGVALGPCLAVGELAGAGAVRLEHVDHALKAAVLALGDGAGAVRIALALTGHQAASSIWPRTKSVTAWAGMRRAPSILMEARRCESVLPTPSLLPPGASTRARN